MSLIAARYRVLQVVKDSRFLPQRHRPVAPGGLLEECWVEGGGNRNLGHTSISDSASVPVVGLVSVLPRGFENPKFGNCRAVLAISRRQSVHAVFA